MDDKSHPDPLDAARRAIDDAIDGDTVRIGGLYRHRKTGRLYVVSALALIEATLAPAVVYFAVGETWIWVRPLSEFTDGRFEPA